jgi:hypothetical protein
MKMSPVRRLSAELPEFSRSSGFILGDRAATPATPSPVWAPSLSTCNRIPTGHP